MTFTELSLNFPSLSSEHFDDLQTRLRSNHTAPSSSGSTVAKRLAGTKADILHCESEISRLHATIIALENISKELHSRIPAYESLLSPIRRLPVELLTKVFLYSAGINEIGRDRPMLLTLGEVCAYWRSVIISDSSLWSTITIHPKCSTMLLQKYLESSGQLPLSLLKMSATSAESERSITESLISHSHRWVDVTLFLGVVLDNQVFTPLRGNLPLLERLEISGGPNIDSTNAFDTAPNLRCLSLQRVSQMSFPWSDVIDFTRKDCHINEFLQDLTRCPRIISARLVDCRGDGTDRSATSQLRDFSMDINRAGMAVTSAFFDAVTFPSVISITLRTFLRRPKGHWPQNTFRMFLFRSSCSLTTFRLIRMPISGPDLIELLGLLPSLINLTIDSLHAPNHDDNNAVLPAVSDAFFNSLYVYAARSLEWILVPQLESLDIKADGSAFSDKSFVDMIKSRWLPAETFAGGSRVKCLQSAALHVTGRPCDAATIEPLHHLGRVGLILSLLDSGGKMQRGTGSE